MAVKPEPIPVRSRDTGVHLAGHNAAPSWLIRIAVMAQYALLFALSGAASFLLRFEFHIPDYYVQHMILGTCVWVVVKLVLFRFGRLDRGQWRNASLPDMRAIVLYSIAGSIIAVPIIYALAAPGFPRSIYLIDLVLTTQMIFGTHALALSWSEVGRRRNAFRNRSRALIYGAGDSGAMLLREFRHNPDSAPLICGFLDDDPAKAGTLLQRVPVLGSGKDLVKLVATHDVNLVLVAMSSCSRETISQILQHCCEAHAQCRIIPRAAELLHDHRLAPQMREIALEDVLGRSPVHLEEEGIRAHVESQVVMVTGAAGSIGSELCRQLARFQPARIIGYEIAETPLFHLEREMKARFPKFAFTPAIGSIQNPTRLREIMREYRPSMVYHAAAYKHVPMMEQSIFEAVENNVFGTHNVAVEAAHAGVRQFVLISSDKAVNPANIMGATKRIAEMVVRDMDAPVTRFMSVRFGNVLGSNGSVVPIFRKQIEAGGPVTVTHPEMRRYFMTIPEAAQLVVQASVFGAGGEIFVLDMGEPVRIVDLARKLILLSGLRPGHDVQIVFSGTRPGEKLHEEVNLDGERTLPTPHQKIKIFRGLETRQDLLAELAEMRRLCVSRDRAALYRQIRALVPDYCSSPQFDPAIARSATGGRTA